MNIFILDYDLEKCAQYHNNKHVVKMILEGTQILSNVHWLCGDSGPYKKTHISHPCTLWAYRCKQNYEWLWQLTSELCKEYNFRYNKIHKCQQVLDLIPKPPDLLGDGESISLFVQAMPYTYQNKDTVIAYRNYYMGEKRHIANWGERGQPWWWK